MQDMVLESISSDDEEEIGGGRSEALNQRERIVLIPVGAKATREMEDQDLFEGMVSQLKGALPETAVEAESPVKAAPQLHDDSFEGAVDLLDTEESKVFALDRAVVDSAVVEKY